MTNHEQRAKEHLKSHEKGVEENKRSSLSIREPSVKCCWCPLKRTASHRPTCNWCLKLSLWSLLVLAITVTSVVVTIYAELDFSKFKYCDVRNKNGTVESSEILNVTTLPENGSQKPVCHDYAPIFCGKLTALFLLSILSNDCFPNLCVLKNYISLSTQTPNPKPQTPNPKPQTATACL